MCVTNMTGLEVVVNTMSYKNIAFHGLTAGIRTLKRFIRSF